MKDFKRGDRVIIIKNGDLANAVGNVLRTDETYSLIRVIVKPKYNIHLNAYLAYYNIIRSNRYLKHHPVKVEDLL